MSETTYVTNALNDNRLKDAIDELSNVVDRLLDRLDKVEAMVGIKKRAQDIKDLDGSISDVQKRLDTLEDNQKTILGLKKK